MKILAADDERLALEMMTDAIRQAYPDTKIYDFTSPSKLLFFAERNACDIAFLDIQMRGMNGVDLARKLKRISPKINIIFVTSYNEFTGEAMEMHASGYILKPVTVPKIIAEMSDLRYQISSGDCDKKDRNLTSDHKQPLLRIQCFGNFDVFTLRNQILHFERSRAKEVLAYLVYLKGTSCSAREIASVLFEDGIYDRKQQSYVQKIISSMLNTLKQYGAETVIEKSYNSIALKTHLVQCDYFDFIRGNGMEKGIVYSGNFMSQYSWAEFVTGYLDRIANR